MTDDSDVRTITGPGADLAAASSLFGVLPEMPTLGRVTNGSVLGFDLALASHASVSLGDGGVIVLDTQGLDRSQGIALHPNETAVTLTLDSGTLDARWARETRSVFGNRFDATFHLDRWRWDSGVPAVAWIGTLRGARVWRGNAVVEGMIDGEASWADEAECFEGGGLRWLIVPRRQSGRRGKEIYDAIVESLDGRDVDAGRLRTSLRAVWFVLGRRVALDYMIGVDKALVPVAAMTVQPEYAAAGERPPIPITVPRSERWHAELFRRLADRISNDEPVGVDITHVATSAYFVAVGEYIEESYLRLQVALESFCSRTEDPDVPPLESRADPASWKAWVALHADEIRGLARSEGDAEVLLGVVKSAYRPSTSKRVERFFERHGVALPPDCRATISGRNTIAHQYRFPERSQNLERELDHVAMSQTLLVAALALFVRYEGPITDSRNWYGSPEWWPWKEGVAPPPVMFRIVTTPPFVTDATDE